LGKEDSKLRSGDRLSSHHRLSGEDGLSGDDWLSSDHRLSSVHRLSGEVELSGEDRLSGDDVWRHSAWEDSDGGGNARRLWSSWLRAHRSLLISRMRHLVTCGKCLG